MSPEKVPLDNQPDATASPAVDGCLELPEAPPQLTPDYHPQSVTHEQFVVAVASNRHLMSELHVYARRSFPGCEPKDLVQSALRKLTEQQNFSYGNPAGWLRTVILNEYRDEHRRRTNGPDFVSLPRDEVEELAPTSGHTNPFEAVESRMILAKILPRLELSNREILVMSFLQDMSDHEIAQQLGVPKGTVKRRRHYALRKARELAEPKAEKKDQTDGEIDKDKINLTAPDVFDV